MAKLFGTDGIRGIAGKELTARLGTKVGAALTVVLKKTRGERPMVLIGKDTRLSGYMFEDAISAGVLSAGGDVAVLHVIPTPGVAHITKLYNVSAGIMISASHNSYEYNGIKIFSSDGFKLSDEEEDEIETLILSEERISGVPELLGKKYDFSEKARNDYISFLASQPSGLNRKLKVVLDSAHGAATSIAGEVFRRLGFANVTMIGDCPDGLNINKDSGSMKPEHLAERVAAEKADVGFAYDGDADRLIAVDEKGEIIDGDRMIYVFAKMLKAKKELRNNAVVATIMSNIGLRQGLSDLGIEMKTTSVGDRYVLEKMRKKNIILGGEQSGHIIFLDKNTTGDGVYASVKLLEAMSFYGRPLSELAGEVTIYPQVMANARVKNEKKKNFEKDAEILTEIEKIKKIHGDDGRVVIRPSGTEPLVRVMIEGEDEAEIKREAEFVAGLIEKKYLT